MTLNTDLLITILSLLIFASVRREGIKLTIINIIFSFVSVLILTIIWEMK